MSDTMTIGGNGAGTGSAPVRITVAFHSGYGHTARQAEAVARGATSVDGAAVETWSVAEHSDDLWASLDAADAIIFGSPTYMGSASAVFQQFAEATSAKWAGQSWAGKVAAGFTNSGAMSGDKLNTLVSFAVLAAQHGMHWVNLGLMPGWASSTGAITDLNRLGGYLGAMAQSDTDAAADVAPLANDLSTAEHLGRRVAEVTRQLRRGADRALNAAG